MSGHLRSGRLKSPAITSFLDWESRGNSAKKIASAGDGRGLYMHPIVTEKVSF